MESRIYHIDLEVSPAKGYFYPPAYETNILKPLDRQHLLSFAWQELSSSKINFEGVNTQSEKELTKKLWKLFDDADIIIAHNSDGFDIKMSKTFFILYGMAMPSNFKSVDTLKVARKHFKFTGNSLDQLAEHFGIPNKVKHDKEMFIGCHENHKDVKRWKLLEKYNKHDVWILDKVYGRLLPYINNHPDRNILEGTHGKCPNCGENKLIGRGYNLTKRGRKRKLQCVGCRSWTQGELERD